MYPRIYLDHRSQTIQVECNQHDVGAIRHFVFDEDLTGKAVKYVIAMDESHNVTDWCTIEDDHHTIMMVIPPQITATAGTYNGQFIVLSQNEIDDDWEAWKTQVLAGSTPIMVETSDTPVTTPPTVTEKAQSATLSFAFKILVYESVYANGDYFEGDLNKLIKQIQADNARITAENTTIKQQIATLSTHCDSEIERVEGLIEDTDVGVLAGRMTAVEDQADATEAWKTQVLAGSTPVMIETEEAPAEDTNADAGTNEADAEVQPGQAQEEGVVENG